MKWIFSLVGFVCFLQLHAQNSKTIAYIEQYKEIAIEEMIRSGVPAAITLAQAVLESQSGESDLVKRSNNHFGIKCKTEWTGAKTYHDDDAKGECFRVYDNPASSFKDHSDFLRTRAHYQFLFKLSPTDTEGWAKGLKKAGYATAPTYAQKLMKIVKDYQLDQYNTIALARINNPKSIEYNTQVLAQSVPQKEESTTHSNNSFAIPETKLVTAVQEIKKQEKDADNEPASETFIPSEQKNTNTKAKYGHYNFPESVFTINNTTVILAKAGTSLLAIANQYNISLAKILQYNELEETDIIAEDQLIYLERKPKKGEQEFYIAKAGESLFEIAQLNGVRLENILQYNSHLNKTTFPSPGTKVFLKMPLSSKSTPNRK